MPVAVRHWGTGRRKPAVARRSGPANPNAPLSPSTPADPVLHSGDSVLTRPRPVPVGSESQLWPGRGERQVPATQSGSGKATVDRKSTFRSLANVDFAEFTSDLFDFEYGRVTPTRGLPAVRWIAAAAASCTATPLNRAGTSRRRGRRVALTWPSCRSILRNGR